MKDKALFEALKTLQPRSSSNLVEAIISNGRLVLLRYGTPLRDNNKLLPVQAAILMQESPYLKDLMGPQFCERFDQSILQVRETFEAAQKKDCRIINAIANCEGQF